MLSVRRVFAGAASVTESGPVPVPVLWLLVSASLLLGQRVPLGPVFLPAWRTARVRQALQMCARKQVFAGWLSCDFWHVDTPVNLALENRGIFKWQFTTKLVAEREKKVPYPH